MPAGRPPLYDSSEKMQELIDEYFSTTEGAPTIAGLCYFLGFEDRHALLYYEEKDEFSSTVKRARLRIEQDRSQRLIGKDTFTPGVIFDLKNNHGWKDKSETEHSGGLEINNVTRSIIDPKPRNTNG